MLRVVNVKIASEIYSMNLLKSQGNLIQALTRFPELQTNGFARNAAEDQVDGLLGCRPPSPAIKSTTNDDVPRLPSSERAKIPEEAHAGLVAR